jgi:plasmid maintenance system antidote protein VapI
MTVTDALRRAINTADTSRYLISKATGIHQATLSRFIHGERGLDGSSIDKLAEYFGLELKPSRRSIKGR